ncbi:hypothetical protein J6590_049615 [Homalodisca vitripennis]|nr:hypothetical protein J6590_049615 [Homalodisca vitripennis]
MFSLRQREMCAKRLRAMARPIRIYQTTRRRPQTYNVAEKKGFQSTSGEGIQSANIVGIIALLSCAGRHGGGSVISGMGVNRHAFKHNPSSLFNLAVYKCEPVILSGYIRDNPDLSRLPFVFRRISPPPRRHHLPLLLFYRILPVRVSQTWPNSALPLIPVPEPKGIDSSRHFSGKLTGFQPALNLNSDRNSGVPFDFPHSAVSHDLTLSETWLLESGVLVHLKRSGKNEIESEEDSCSSSVPSPGNQAMGVPMNENMMTNNRIQHDNSQDNSSPQHSTNNNNLPLPHPETKPLHLNGSLSGMVNLHNLQNLAGLPTSQPAVPPMAASQLINTPLNLSINATGWYHWIALEGTVV